MPGKFKAFVRQVMTPRQLAEAAREVDVAEQGIGIVSDSNITPTAVEIQSAQTSPLPIASQFGTWPMLRSSARREAALISPRDSASTQGEGAQSGSEAASSEAAALEAATPSSAAVHSFLAPSSPTAASLTSPVRASRTRRSPLPNWSVRASSHGSTLLDSPEAGDSYPEPPSPVVQEQIQTRAADVRNRVARIMDDTVWLDRPVSGVTMQELPWLKETTELLDSVSASAAEAESSHSSLPVVQQNTATRTVPPAGKNFSREQQQEKGNLAMLKGSGAGQDDDEPRAVSICHAAAADSSVQAGPSESVSSVASLPKPTVAVRKILPRPVSASVPKPTLTKVGSRFKEQLQSTGQSISPGRRATLRVSPWSSATQLNDSGENLGAAITRCARLPPQSVHPALRQTATSARSDLAAKPEDSATPSPVCDEEEPKPSSRYSRAITAPWTLCHIATLSAVFLSAIVAALLGLVFYPRGVAISSPSQLGGGPRNFTLFAEDGSRLVLQPLPGNLTLMQLYPMRSLLDSYDVGLADEQEFRRVVGGLENLHWAHTRWSAIVTPRLWQIWVLCLAIIGVYQALCAALRWLVVVVARRRWDSGRGRARSLVERWCERALWQGREIAVVLIAGSSTAVIVAVIVCTVLGR